MSDEALDNQEPEQEQEQQQEQHQEEAPKGHMSKEAWEESGKDPEEWRSPEVFEERGKWINRVKGLEGDMKSMQTGFDQRIQGLNQLHNHQLQNTIKDLEAKRDSAIDEADTPAAKVLQEQIDQTRVVQNATQAPAQAPARDPAIASWEADNAWVMNPDDPKTAFANAKFNQYAQQPGMTAETALKLVDSDISKAFPDVNHNRNNASVAEGARGPGGKRSAATQSVSWEDLTHQEKVIYNSGPEAWGTKEKFLKAVADDRKGA